MQLYVELEGVGADALNSVVLQQQSLEQVKEFQVRNLRAYVQESQPQNLHINQLVNIFLSFEPFGIFLVNLGPEHLHFLLVDLSFHLLYLAAVLFFLLIFWLFLFIIVVLHFRLGDKVRKPPLLRGVTLVIVEVAIVAQVL